ncbi:MAG TPA: hypothetical protein VFX12_09165 [Vicinamibacterales bacterium]|nr:hypothetical protein [Vicinamibacterales bacterium]
MTKRRGAWLLAIVVLVAAAAGLARAVPNLPTHREEVPTTRVVRGALKLTVYANGELRAGRTATLVAPRASGTLRLVKLLPTGTAVKAGDVVMEFDPADQQYALEQAQSDLDGAEQQIVKAKADNEVQAAQDKVDLLTARYDVRRAELDTAGNEFVGEIDARKNQLSLEEARRKLAQLEHDVTSRSATNQATLDVQLEARNKARVSMQRAQTAMDGLVIAAPMDGVISVKENRDATGGMFFYGMVLPEYREGDTVFSGRPVVDVIERGRMELRAKIDETDRDNLQPGETARVQIDALPGEWFTAKVGALSGLATRSGVFDSSAVRRFDVAFTFDKVDPRFRAGSSARLVIEGRELQNVLHVPRQAVFDKNGKNFVYLKVGDAFQRRDVKVTNRTESRAVLEGLQPGDTIALVDPDVARARAKSGASAPMPASGSAS